jgi:hypothetical protein
MIILLVILLVILSAVSEGIMDTLQFHYLSSRFKNFKNHLFWDPYHSWRNKYKNGDPKQGERFPLSTTLLVGFTDGWHLFKLLRNLFLFGSIFTILLFFSVGIYKSIFITIFLRVIFGVSFTLIYKFLGD